MTRRELLQRMSVGALALYGVRSLPAAPVEAAPLLAVNDCQIFASGGFCAPMSPIYDYWQTRPHPSPVRRLA